MYKIVYLFFLLITQCASDQSSLYKAKPAQYSYIISGIKDNKIYKEYNSEIYSFPASCQKIITGLVALKYLESDYQYKTKLYSSNDDDVILFSEDPNLTSIDLIDLLKIIESKKYNKIILYSSIFKTNPHSSNPMIDDIGTYYAQPVNSINIDNNIINIKVKPKNLGESAYIFNDLDYNINSVIKTTNAKTSISLIWNGEKIEADGNVNINDNSYEYKISPNDIDLYVIKKIGKILKELHIEGKIELFRNNNNLPTKINLINSVYSRYLKDSIIVSMKNSNNLFFDSLYLNIIHSYKPNEIKDWNDCDPIIKNLIMKYFNVDINDAIFVDGSGLSRYNRIQPRNLVEILNNAYDIPEFIDSLPVSEEKDTTLYKRNNLSNDIIAKTGNMSGLSCLCGYNISSNKSFVIIADNFVKPHQEIFPIIDNFINNNIK